jgi:predicted RNase H-like nuclease
MGDPSRETRMQGAVLGVDWCRRGWVAVALRGHEEPSVMLGRDLGELIERVPDVRCVAVDMPIGLPKKARPCDRLARAFVGPRYNSLFPTAPREVLDAETYEDANRVAVRLLDGKKISKQTYSLATNIRAVAMLAERDARLIEVHPEVSFRALTGNPVQWAKTTWNGQMIRRRHLESAGVSLPEELSMRLAVCPFQTCSTPPWPRGPHAVTPPERLSRFRRTRSAAPAR